MKTVSQARAACRDRLVRSMGDWAAAVVRSVALDPAAVGVKAAPLSTPRPGAAAGAVSGEWVPVVQIALAPPSEKEMLRDEGAAEEWAREWAAFSPPDGVEVEWTTRA